MKILQIEALKFKKVKAHGQGLLTEFLPTRRPEASADGLCFLPTLLQDTSCFALGPSHHVQKTYANRKVLKGNTVLVLQ